MAVRTRRLFGPVLISANPTALFTCPADRTAILKYLTAVNQIGAVTTYRLLISTGGSGQEITAPRSLATGTETPAPDRDMWVVLQEGDILQARASVLNTVLVSGHGTLLDGDPQ